MDLKHGSMFSREVGVSDMCLLEELNEENILDNLSHRFRNEHIYTYIGSVVISINPYKKLNYYDNDVIERYKSRNLYEMPPHVFAISDEAYRSMRDRNYDQCVIITGESGSGKTEVSKIIMQYVAAVSGKGKDIDLIKEQLLQSNPVLEAFGNAKTNRNDNSSRFGKYMDIKFDFKGNPVGGIITSYLLEKSRVIQHSESEHNFHIFYQLIKCSNKQLLDYLHLKEDSHNYDYIKTAHLDKIDDADNFNVTRRALDLLGFNVEDVTSIFQLVASILHLGNLRFATIEQSNNNDGCVISNQQDFKIICDLLGCSKLELTKALTARTVQSSKDTINTSLKDVEAIYAREALCKAIYSRLLNWIIEKINLTIKPNTKHKTKSIGVLDIYGFEIFQVNSFEQFIINYCNEKLQQIFIELTLKGEQLEYVNEGIEWIHVEYFNNSIICELIEKNNEGVLAMLDEECLRPGEVSDITFLAKLNTTCCSHEHFQSRGCRKSQADRTLPHDAFRLIHYAGDVTYHIHGFLDKNSDLLYKDLSRAMFSSSNKLLKTLFPEGDIKIVNLKRPPTASFQFKNSVNELMKNLRSKNPNYIRCIKPNDKKASEIFNDDIIRHQIRYLGLLENIRVRRAGYAYRQTFEKFLFRFKMLSSLTWPRWTGKPSDGIVNILNSLVVDKEEYAIGRTKIFVKNPRTLFMLESLRKEKLNELATLLQKLMRGWLMRMRFKKMKQAQLVISATYRCYKARSEFLQKCAANLVICSYARGWKARKIVGRLRLENKVKTAMEVIWRCYVGHQVRKQYRKKFKSVAGLRIAMFTRRYFNVFFLNNVKKNLPSLSPTDNKWIVPTKIYKNSSDLLKTLFHKNRCKKEKSTDCDSALITLLCVHG